MPGRPSSSIAERLKNWLRRRWLLLVVAIAFLVFILTRLGEFAAIGMTLIGGNWLWVGAAAILQVGYYLLYAYAYQLGFAVVGVASSALQLVPVLLASQVVQVAVPSGGVAGLVVFVDDARRRGQSAARAAEGTLFVLLAVLVGLLPLLLLGLGYLLLQGAQRAYQVAGSLAYLGFTAFVAGLVFLGRWRPGLLGRAFRALEWLANWVARRMRRPPLEPGWGNRQAEGYVDAARNITRQPRQLRRILAVGVGLQLINVASLYAVALAFNAVPTPGSAIAAFSFSVVFSVAAPVPLGLGVSESVIAAVLASLGLEVGTSSAIALVFRGLSLYLPLLIGFVLLRQLRTFGGERW